MRDIKFRAKRVDNGEWVEGNFIKDGKPDMREFYIQTVPTFDETFGILYEVDPNTIGQFTGLCDKNGKEIYEGDIVLTQPIKNKPYSKSAKAKRRVGKVVWNSGKRDGSSFITEPTFIIEFIDNENDYRCWNWSLFYDCEVIGNIYDNPELLKGE